MICTKTKKMMYSRRINVWYIYRDCSICIGLVVESSNTKTFPL